MVKSKTLYTSAIDADASIQLLYDRLIKDARERGMPYLELALISSKMKFSNALHKVKDISAGDYTSRIRAYAQSALQAIYEIESLYVGSRHKAKLFKANAQELQNIYKLLDHVNRASRRLKAQSENYMMAHEALLDFLSRFDVFMEPGKNVIELLKNRKGESVEIKGRDIRQLGWIEDEDVFDQVMLSGYVYLTPITPSTMIEDNTKL